VVVVVEMAGRSFSGRRIESGAIDDENIRPAVVVVIEDGDARSGGFNDVFLGVRAAENDLVGESGFGGDVGEMSERFGSALRALRGAKEKGNRKEQCKKSPGGFETEPRTIGRTGNHELLAY